MTKPATALQITPKPVTRTAEGVRNLLFDEIDKLRNGTGDRRRAATIAQLVGQIVAVVKVEVEYHRQLALLGRDGAPLDEAHKLGALQLGTPAE